MSKIFKIVPLFCLGILAMALTGCSNSKDVREYSKQDFLLGTVCDIKVYKEEQLPIIDETFKKIKEIENIMTIRENSDASEIKALNDAAGSGKWVTLSQDTLNVLKKAIVYSEITDGKFDPSIGVLTTKWNIGSENERVPEDKEISDGLKLINYKNIELDEKSSKARLLKKGMIIDLGAIAKGYAGDVAKKYMIEKGVENSIINLGGNIVLIGSNPNGKDWSVGIQNPFKEGQSYFGIVRTNDKSIVSSGVYERYFEKDGKHYHHILDVKTGYPCENSVVGTTIVTQESVDGDGFSTGVFLLGAEKGLELMKSKGVDGLIVTKDKKIYMTEGFKAMFELKDPTYKIAK